MKRSSILKFNEIVKLWLESSCKSSIPELLGLVANGQNESASAYYTLEELHERFRDTWWELIWPNYTEKDSIIEGVQCRYVADSLPDALRNRPLEDFPHVEAQEIMQTYDFEDESDYFVDDQQSFQIITH